MKRTLVLVALVATSVFAADTPDPTMQNRIRQEGFRNSKVMETAEELMDFVGPRLTGSPNMKRANEWTRDKLTSFGLSNAHLESWGPFGRGWSYEECTVRMTVPDVAQLWALPRAWTPGTNGVISGQPIRVKIETVEDIEKYRGKLAGKIVLNGDVREIKPHEQAQFSRATDKMLADLQTYELPGKPRFTREEIVKRNAFRKALSKFLAEEKPLVMIDSDSADFGTFHVQAAGSQRDGESYPVPSIVMSTEHYNRLARLVDQKKDVTLEVNIKTKYYDDDKNAYNTIAEIPGTDKKGEIVMLGGHLDSWHGGTGATDNGAGVVVAMEAARIIKAIGIAPKRTIRVALWSGEEEGLLGSRAYVSEHFASRPEPTAAERDLPAAMRTPGPLTMKPEHAKLSAYFNLDNGTGKIRGIYAQENYAVAPIFQSWIEPLKDLGVTTVTERNTGSTDHVSFDGVGLPGFQFIQDEVEYEQRTHHTNYDVYDRLQRDDLMQAAVVMATFVWEAANRPEMMPRKPLAAPH
ncbi:MAG TPA: M20/M25/M40 family metallo-hydrolase [Thermoanaerobaculia bacterium]|nr:M20/M25/M40 family metallo-hydrolase [Thermoanaerobaculia bacterium]